MSDKLTARQEAQQQAWAHGYAAGEASALRGERRRAEQRTDNTLLLIICVAYLAVAAVTLLKLLDKHGLLGQLLVPAQG